MGFYDTRCAISGLSTLCSRVYLILLKETASGVFAPIALPITGRYNRLGGIDAHEGGVESQILRGFQHLRGELWADEKVAPLPADGEEDDLDRWLGAIERSCTEKKG